ncbi:MAG: DUF367 domain-containing protein [Myxococcales bacterium]|nr:DUF367 domain-containing protein [Myxococcales bacterium]
MHRDILIVRDRRESKKKCSLTPLRGMNGIVFINDHPERRVQAAGRILLDPDGEPFSPADRGMPLLLVDSSWRRVRAMTARIDGPVRRRRLPALVTAYPRVSRNFADPSTGLASIEALFVASLLVGAPALDLIDAYRWKDLFLLNNADYLATFGL